MPRIIIGLIITIISSLIVIKTEWLVQNIGHNTWAETHLGAEGGTRLMYKLIGVLGIIIGLFLITGLYDSFIRWLLSPLIRTSKNL